jgi:hypothetical protein
VCPLGGRGAHAVAPWASLKASVAPPGAAADAPGASDGWVVAGYGCGHTRLVRLHSQGPRAARSARAQRRLCASRVRFWARGDREASRRELPPTPRKHPMAGWWLATAVGIVESPGCIIDGALGTGGTMRCLWSERSAVWPQGRRSEARAAGAPAAFRALLAG